MNFFFLYLTIFMIKIFQNYMVLFLILFYFQKKINKNKWQLQHLQKSVFHNKTWVSPSSGVAREKCESTRTPIIVHS